MMATHDSRVSDPEQPEGRSPNWLPETKPDEELLYTLLSVVAEQRAQPTPKGQEFIAAILQAVRTEIAPLREETLQRLEGEVTRALVVIYSAWCEHEAMPEDEYENELRRMLVAHDLEPTQNDVETLAVTRKQIHQETGPAMAADEFGGVIIPALVRASPLKLSQRTMAERRKQAKRLGTRPPHDDAHLHAMLDVAHDVVGLCEEEPPTFVDPVTGREVTMFSDDT